MAAANLRKVYHGTIIVAGGFEREGAEEIVESGAADLVAFGRHFSANPDLPRRLRERLPLTSYDRDTFWGGDHRGYTDFAEYQELAVA